MKTSPFRFGRRLLVKTLPSSAVLATALLASLGSSLEAATYTKANSVDNLDTTLSWVEGVVPTSADIALWNNTVTAANITTAGAGVNFGQIKIANPTGLVTINVDPTLLGGLTLTGVDGVGIDMTTSTGNLTINAPLTLAGNQQWNVASGRTLTIGGTTGFNQGANNLTLNGAGTVLFAPTFGTAANTTSTGSITVNNGVLDIFSGNTTGFPQLNNVLSPLTTLVVGGGAVSTRVGNSVGTFTQSFNGLTINAGASSFTQARGSSSLVVVNLGSITRNVGGTANLAPTSNNSGYRTTSTDVNGILSGGLTLNGTDFAHSATAASNISAAVYTNDTWGGTTNTTVTLDLTQTDATTNSLRFAAAAARTLTLAGVNTVTSGGILNSSAVGAFGNVITGGTLTSGGSDLIVHQFDTAAPLTIGSTIADNASAMALTKSGGGVLVLTGNNTFTGGVNLNAGSIQLGSAGALNSSAPNAVRFGNNSNGILSLGGNSVTIGGLTSADLGTTRPTVQNANATAATLTINNAIDNTYGGNIQDGAGGGALSLVKQGAGTLNLTGTSLTYGGNTTIAQGKLAVSSNLGGSVTISSGATLDVTKVGAGQVFANGKSLSGSGTVLGTVTLGTGTTANPGGTGTIGSLTIDTLNLNTGSVVNFEFGAAGASDKIITTTALNIGTYASGGFNLLTTGGGQLTTTGVAYTLFDYTTGSVSGFGNLSSALVLNPVGGLNYTFTSDPINHRITLTLSGTPAISSNWIQDGPSGNWSVGANWQGGVIPSGASQTANFVSTTPNNPAHTVNLDSNRTVGVVKFNSPTAYTISGANTLTLDNGANNAFISVEGGSHNISTALNLASTLSVAVLNAADTLTVSGVVGGTPAGGLIKSGAGTLALTAANTYSGGTLVTDGLIRFSSLASLGSGDITLVGGGGLSYDVGNTADISTRLLTLGTGGGKIDVGANDVTFNNSIGNAGDGGLIKAGTGSLTLVAANSYKGATSINAGTLSISSNGNLGDETVGAAVNLNGGALRATTILTLGAGGINRGIVTNGGAISVDTGMTLTLPGVVSGSGGLILNGPGTVSLTNADNTYTGGTQVIGGTLLLGVNLSGGRGGIPLNSGTITLNNGTLSNLQGANNTLVYDATTPIVNSGISTINTPNRFAFNSSVSGTGTLNIVINGTVSRADFQNNFAGFTGNLNVTGSGTARFGINALGTGSPNFNAAGTANTALTLDGVFFAPTTNSGGNTWLIGSLSSTGATGGLNGGTAGAITYSIGGLNTNTTYGGVISGNAILTKTGTGVQTLTGVNTYTGVTNVTGGTLELGTTGSLAGTPTLNVATGATLKLDNGISLNDAITLSLVTGSSLNLNFTAGEIETVNMLSLNGVFAEGRTYTVAELQALDAGINFTGTGSLTVTTVPEPGTIALLLGGAGMMALIGRRRRSRVS